MNNQKRYPLLIRLLLPIGIFLCLVILHDSVQAQEQPPKPIAVKVSTAQNLSFGTFIQSGSSGTVIVDYDYKRSKTGSIILPNISSIVSPALFLVDALPGTLITINNGPDVPISSGGYSLNLHIGEASTGSQFIARSNRTYVYIGGTLTVGPLSANPAGAYSGSFTVTFIQQ